MFDFSFGEILLIALLGLVVLGPERLPSALATGARWLAMTRQTINRLKTELSHELEVQALRDQLKEAQDLMRHPTTEVRHAESAPATTPPLSAAEAQIHDHPNR